MSVCSQGHELTPVNSRREKSSVSRGGFRIRCKTCIRLRYRRRYRTDEQFRIRALAYAHWFRCGHPEGKGWGQIKMELRP
jgi:hypothetical protein